MFGSVSLTSFILFAFFFLSLFFSQTVEAYSSGAPICSTTDLSVINGMQSSIRQTTNGGWTVSSSSSTYTPGQALQITLSSTSGVGLRGFTLQAQPSASAGTIGGGIGSFSVSSGLSLGVSSPCLNSPSFLTHSSAFTQRVSLEVTWTAPATGQGDIVFTAIVYTRSVGSPGNFWVAASLSISPAPSTTPRPPTTTTTTPSITTTEAPPGVELDVCRDGPLLPCPWHATCQNVPGKSGLSLDARTCTCKDPNYPATGSRDCCALPINHCAADEFHCNNGKCIKDLFVCTSTDECGDGSDELHCRVPCPAGTFQCANKVCVSLAARCSFTNECGDNSDEIGCDVVPCPRTAFQCLDTSGGGPKCIPKWRVCDSSLDCLDESDEDGCMQPVERGCDAFLIDCKLSGNQSAILGQMIGFPWPPGLTRCVTRAMHCNGHMDCIIGDADERDCIETCVPNCAGRSCGDDNCCGGLCGGDALSSSCPSSFPYCSPEGLCTCAPTCTKASICSEPDGCGGTCQGSCTPYSNGEARTCVVPQHFCSPIIVMQSTDVPKAIGVGKQQVVSSELMVNRTGVVLDVDVLQLRGQHEWFGDMRMSLKSPEGTVVEIVKRFCSPGETGAFFMTLDDHAPLDEMKCPPDVPNVAYKPSFPLKAFNGQDSQGIWKLYIFDEFDLDVGTLEGWGLGIAICTPTCEVPVATCGSSDSCGGYCMLDNGCPVGYVCSTNLTCVCAPDCSAATRCGDNDGCGGVCDVQSCPAESSCIKGVCTVPVYVCTDVPINLDSNQASLHRSFIDVPPPGRPIVDIDVLDLGIYHTEIGDVALLLKSPQGTLVELVTPRCRGHSNMFISFNDQAPSGLWPCPAIDAGTYRPAFPLSKFDGEIHSGRWELLIVDGEEQAGGRLEKWSLRIETCAPRCTTIDIVCGSADSCGGKCVVQKGCLANQTCNAQGVCACTPDCSKALACGDPDGCGGFCTVQTCSLPSSHWDVMCEAGHCVSPIYWPDSAEMPIFRSGAADFAQVSQIMVDRPVGSLVKDTALEDVKGLWTKGSFDFWLTSPLNTSVHVSAEQSLCPDYRGYFSIGFNDSATVRQDVSLPCPLPPDTTLVPASPLSLSSLSSNC
eukprot:gb/GEZN01000394.1/.p1 GENE.gb/GEZN01000394.1/~~gb/GEZN01000394.1/.p1  ORF type:complete len:1111 (+),score=96.48 gb/GEZN01000394.1/:35-3367(+)